jgi:hypothetical protein
MEPALPVESKESLGAPRLKLRLAAATVSCGGGGGGLATDSNDGAALGRRLAFSSSFVSEAASAASIRARRFAAASRT